MSKTFTAEQVAEHNTRDDLWIIYEGKVYDVTQYLDEHPGGEEVILDCAGADSTDAFNDIGHSEDAKEMLTNLYVGDLIGGVKSKVDAKNKASNDSNTLLIVAGAVAVVIVAYFLIK